MTIDELKAAYASQCKPWSRIMTAPLTSAELDALETAHAAMTPAPWSQGEEHGDHEDYNVDGPDGDPLFAGVESTDDVEGIIALRNAFPRLAAALRAAWEELAEEKPKAAYYDADHQVTLMEWSKARDLWHKERDTLAARLAEAERLLRLSLEYVKPVARLNGTMTSEVAAHSDAAGMLLRNAAAFLAQTTPTAAAPQEK